MKSVYVKVLKNLKINRTVALGNGVQIDVNDVHGIVGVEVVAAVQVKVDGKEIVCKK